MTATIDPNATLLIATEDQTNITKGWVEVRADAPLGGYAVFRSGSRSASPVEGAIPLQSQFAASVTVPFDNSSEYSTGVAIANPNPAPVVVTASISDEGGRSFGTATISIAANGHTELFIPQEFPLSAGKRGILKLQASAGATISAVALRLNRFGAIVSLPNLN